MKKHREGKLTLRGYKIEEETHSTSMQGRSRTPGRSDLDTGRIVLQTANSKLTANEADDFRISTIFIT